MGTINAKTPTPCRRPVDLPPHDTILVRYGELGIKSHAVRSRMERKLVGDLENGLVRRGVEGVVRRTQGRVWIEAQDMQAAGDVAAHTFGVTTYSPVVRVPSAFDTILEAAAAYQRARWPEGARTFAIRARRSGEHPYTSQDIAIQAGSSVYKAAEAAGIDVAVELDEPDWELHIEVRDAEAFLFDERYTGPGGLPLGTQGKLVVVLDTMDAAAAAYLMMRRGAQVYPLYLPQVVGTQRRHDPPRTVDADDHPATGIHEALLDWNAPGHLKQWWVDEELLDKAVEDGTLHDDGVPLCRLQLEAAAKYARMIKADAVVTGETRAAPWAHRLPETQGASDLPVLRPLMGLSRPMIDDFREAVGLPRQAGPRADESERAFTAGGRREGRRARTEEHTASEGAGWDPW